MVEFETKTRILVVDDTAVDRQLAGGLLELSPSIKVEYAENGKLALDAMEQSLPDLVVTDMQMPELDGLALVSEIRAHYPGIPVVLMTAKGSEAIAVEALERGAASYVPKSQLAEILQTTVSDLLSMVYAHKSHSQLMECQKKLECEYELGNDPALIDSLVDLSQQMLAGMDLTDETGVIRVGVALREALYNSLYHGNLEISDEDLESSRETLLTGGDSFLEKRRSQSPYCDRRIRVKVVINREQAVFEIGDDGDGFDYVSVLASASEEDVDVEGGRGFLLMLSMMDEVSFNETGSCVKMIKRKESAVPVEA